MREGDFNILLIEALLELSGERISECAIVFLDTPCAQKKIERRVPKSGENDQRIGFVQRLEVCLSNLLHNFEDVSDILIVSDANIEVESAYWMTGDINQLSLDEGLVRDAYRAVVEGAQGES